MPERSRQQHSPELLHLLAGAVLSGSYFLSRFIGPGDGTSDASQDLVS